MSEVREEDTLAAQELVYQWHDDLSQLIEEIAQLRADAFSAGLEAAAKAMCSMCSNPTRYSKPTLIEGSMRLFHFQLSDNWNAGQCEASAIRSLSPNVAEPQSET